MPLSHNTQSPWIFKQFLLCLLNKVNSHIFRFIKEFLRNVASFRVKESEKIKPFFKYISFATSISQTTFIETSVCLFVIRLSLSNYYASSVKPRQYFMIYMWAHAYCEWYISLLHVCVVIWNIWDRLMRTNILPISPKRKKP